MHPSSSDSHRIVIVGGGIAGIEIAAALGRKARQHAKRRRPFPTITLIDSDVAHVWKPMLHTIAAGTRDISQQQTPFLAQAREAGFAFRPGRLIGLDRTSRQVQLAAITAPDGRQIAPPSSLGYDTLIMAIGSEANDFGTPGVAEHAWRIDSRRQAMAFHQELRLRMTQCLAQDTPLSIAIVGGGATGVELAAELVQLTDTLAAYAGGGLAEHVTITLAEAGPRLLPAFPEDISAATKARLESLGVDVLLGAQVSAAHDDAFMLADGRRIPASLKVWAAGVKAPDFLAGLDGLATNRAHQLVVTPQLHTTQDPHVFAIGDCASLTPAGAERALPPTAQVAHQQAQFLISHLPPAILRDTAMPDFKYHDFGSLVSLADYEAYGSLGKFGLLTGVTFRGHLAHFSHVLLYRSHQAKLHGFWRGSLLWWIDWLNARVRAPIRLD